MVEVDLTLVNTFLLFISLLLSARLIRSGSRRTMRTTVDQLEPVTIGPDSKLVPMLHSHVHRGLDRFSRTEVLLKEYADGDGPGSEPRTFLSAVRDDADEDEWLRRRYRQLVTRLVAREATDQFDEDYRHCYEIETISSDGLVVSIDSKDPTTVRRVTDAVTSGLHEFVEAEADGVERPSSDSGDGEGDGEATGDRDVDGSEGDATGDS